MYDFSKEVLLKIVEQGVNRNIMVYDRDTKYVLSLKLLALIDNCIRENSDNKNKLTTIVVSSICMAEIKQYIVENKYNSILSATIINNDNITLCGINIITSYFYKEYLDYYIKYLYRSLANGDYNLVIALDLSGNPDLDNLEPERVLLASY